MTAAGVADERGSILPLVLGFFLVALLFVGGAITAGEAYVHQRALQQTCDGAAAAAGASALGLDRDTPIASSGYAVFSGADAAIDGYLHRDAERRSVRITTTSRRDGTWLTLRCTETRGVAFGVMFGLGSGVHHSAVASVRAPLD